MKIGKYILIGFAFDVLDWVGLGLIPVLMDVVDVFAALFWYSKLGVVGLASAIELIPLVDLAPTNIILGFMADQKEGKKK